MVKVRFKILKNRLPYKMANIVLNIVLLGISQLLRQKRVANTVRK